MASASSMAKIITKQAPPRPNALAAVSVFAWRSLLKIKHLPNQLLEAALVPIIITLMFTYIFGGAIAGSVNEYLKMVLPGIAVMAAIQISNYAGLAMATDISKGIFDRFRSMSMWHSSPLVGALAGDIIRYAVAATTVVLVGLLLGFRTEAGFAGVALGIIAVVVFVFSLSWVWITLGVLVRTPAVVAGLSAALMFPLLFASNIFVSPTTMPDWLQKIVDINPVTHVVTGVRGLMHGTITDSQLLWLVLACAILLVIFMPLAMYLYRNKGVE